MKRDEVWEELRKDDTRVYGKPMLDAFLELTSKLEESHWDELDPEQRKSLEPGLRLAHAETDGERQKAFKELIRATNDPAETTNLALVKAARFGNIDSCMWLLKRGARLFRAALVFAARRGDLDICRLIHSASDLQSADLEWILAGAAEFGHLKVCEWLVSKGAKDFDMALLNAAYRGHIDVVKWAIEKGARDIGQALDYTSDPKTRKYLLDIERGQ